MHFPKYPLTSSTIAKRFWPETSDGACFSVGGQILHQKETDKDGNDVMRATPFKSVNPNHIRFTTKKACLQWLQKIGRKFAIIQSDDILIN